jgi:glyoxylase-like metal-dependent hydrolase (beta-lactamase superfamily II)
LEPAGIRWATVVSELFEENCYLAYLEGRSDCLVIDPGLDPDRIFDELDRRKLVPAAILDTHGHADHIAGNGALKRRWPDCPLLIGTADAPKLTDAMLNLSEPFGMGLTSPPADLTVDDGDRIQYAGIELEVLSIPGHSAGEVVYLARSNTPPVAFVGDVIFSGSVGRSDFPDGDYDALIEGIRSRLLTLPEATVLLSGHGPATTVGREKRFNPFVGAGR